MADLRLRINELPEELTPAPIDNIAIDGPTTRRTTLQRAADAVRPYSTEAMAREGLNNATAMTPLRVSQAIETLGGQRFATAQQGNKADTAVQPTLTITAGTGLTGGGTLAANRTLALSSTSLASLGLADSAVQPARQVIAGAGLTGGGSLAADRTISLDATTQASLGRADSAVQPARTVSAGTGLTGGGNLSADRTIALNAASIASLAKADSAVQPSRSINPGAGLSGGGDLSADRALSLSSATQASLAKADSAIQAPGGTAGQILAKASDEPGAVGWVSIEGATAVSYGPQSLTAEQQEQARLNIGSMPASAAIKSAPADNDGFAITDSADGGVPKRTLWSSLKTALAAIFYNKTEVNNIVAGNMAGRAYPRRADGAAMNFSWSGQGGQPSWLWGANEPGTDIRVYNPSNFSVNYANSAWSCNNVGGWSQATIADQLNWRVTDTQFAGFLTNDIYTTGTRTTPPGGGSGYVVTTFEKLNVEAMRIHYRQPQRYIPNQGWRALGGW